MATCTVYFRDRAGRLAGHVTAGDTLFHVAKRALAWFADPHWQGPEPVDDTVPEVCAVGTQERTYYVRAGTVRARLMPRPPGPAA